MNTTYPDSLYAYYHSNPLSFEGKENKQKKMIYYSLVAVCILLIIFPAIIPIGNWLIRIAAVIGLLYFGFSAIVGDMTWYNKQSGGKITEIAIKKFAIPERGTVPFGTDDQKVMQMFANEDWAGLADEEECDDRPLQLYIHEDEVGKTFYLQLKRFTSASDFRGVSDVKVLPEPQYSEVYKILKSIKSTK
jgi:hypothetical protein